MSTEIFRVTLLDDDERVAFSALYRARDQQEALDRYSRDKTAASPREGETIAIRQESPFRVPVDAEVR